MSFSEAMYLEYLKNFRFKPEEVEICLTRENDLDMRIKGPWHSTILWEIVLMAAVSELYFTTIEKEWNGSTKNPGTPESATLESVLEAYGEKILEIGKVLEENGCLFSEFGTRRRRSFELHDQVMRSLVRIKTLTGTSNVYFAKNMV